MDDLLVNGVSLVAVIMGLVEFSKKFGLKGRALTALSMGLGIVLGIAHRIAQNGTPQTFADWFNTVIFGLSLGLAASGLYDFADKRWPKLEG